MELKVFWPSTLHNAVDLESKLRFAVKEFFGHLPKVQKLSFIVIQVGRSGNRKKLVRIANLSGKHHGVPVSIWTQGGQGVDGFLIADQMKAKKLRAVIEIGMPKPERVKVKPVKKTNLMTSQSETTLRLSRKSTSRPVQKKGVTVIVKKATPQVPTRPIERLSVLETAGLPRARSILRLRQDSAVVH